MKIYAYATTDLSDNEIVNRFDDAGIEVTDDLSQAIYLLRDGTLISGGFCDSIRGEDHRCVECLFDDIDRYSPNFWEDVFRRTGMIMLVPETRQALMSKSQVMTAKQREVLDRLNYYVMKE